MKLGVMQPYFFPYIGYFQLINAVDQWVVFDTPQYFRHGWINRNRVLHPQAGPKYIVVPLAKHQKETPIREVLVHPTIEWKAKMIGQLRSYYAKKAKFVTPVVEMVEKSFETPNDSLTDLLVN